LVTEEDPVQFALEAELHRRMAGAGGSNLHDDLGHQLSEPVPVLAEHGVPSGEPKRTEILRVFVKSVGEVVKPFELTFGEQVEEVGVVGLCEALPDRSGHSAPIVGDTVRGSEVDVLLPMGVVGDFKNLLVGQKRRPDTKGAVDESDNAL